MRAKAQLREVGLRDGLQMVKTILSTDQKFEWCSAAIEAGVRELEVTSFVPPSLFPQFADAEEIVRRVSALDGLRIAVLAPNLKGATRALQQNLDVLNIVVSASEAHSLANVRRSSEMAIADFSEVVQLRKAIHGKQPLVAGCIATAFGCTIQGVVPEKRVLDIAAQLAELGADEIVIADTVGYADPGRVKRLLRRIMEVVSPLPVACHFHDTRGLGLANLVAAVDAGVTAFDASLGGLGGCPFAPGASGNINTEDAAFLLDRLGFETGIQIEALIELRRRVEGWLPEDKFAGSLAKAGLPISTTKEYENA